MRDWVYQVGAKWSEEEGAEVEEVRVAHAAHPGQRIPVHCVDGQDRDGLKGIAEQL